MKTCNWFINKTSKYCVCDVALEFWWAYKMTVCDPQGMRMNELTHLVMKNGHSCFSLFSYANWLSILTIFTLSTTHCMPAYCKEIMLMSQMSMVDKGYTGCVFLWSVTTKNHFDTHTYTHRGVDKTSFCASLYLFQHSFSPRLRKREGLLFVGEALRILVTSQ